MATTENSLALASIPLDNIYNLDNISLYNSKVVQENLDLLDTCPKDYLLYL
jgi:hypothetical protein